MPEGDTIHRTAEVLRAVLLGRTITAARAQPHPGLRRVPDLGRLAGTLVTSVEARGKHLLIGLDNGMTLRTHMQMAGSWHRYRPGEPWRRPAREATVVLETPESVAVCFNAPVAELLTDAELGRHRSLAALGRDLLAPDFDAEEALRRLRDRADLALGDALLDQRVVAGIGNVYKSEACFVARLDPWAPVASFDHAELETVVRTARDLMRANLRGGPRATTGHRARGPELWVYSRAGRPCRRCGTLIRSGPQGELLRLTYWCPRCQPARAGDGEDGWG
jgi:endonuclease VIII